MLSVDQITGRAIHRGYSLYFYNCVDNVLNWWLINSNLIGETIDLYTPEEQVRVDTRTRYKYITSIPVSYSTPCMVPVSWNPLYTCIQVSLYPDIPCILVSLYPGIPVSWNPCILVSLYPGIPVSWYPCILVSLYPGIPVSFPKNRFHQCKNFLTNSTFKQFFTSTI